MADVFYASGATDVGKVRENNEDNYCISGHFLREKDKSLIPKYTRRDVGTALYAVCDGIGGAAYGEVASAIAAEGIADAYDKLCAVAEYDDVEIDKRIICAAMRAINKRILRKGIEIGCEQMGTTCAVLFLRAGKGLICSIGDSRIYRCRDGRLEMLTTDQTQAQAYYSMGMMTYEEANKSAFKHHLTGYLGMQCTPSAAEEAVVSEIQVKIGDSFILCSDGLTDMLSDDDILTIIRSSNADSTADELVKAALKAGGTDNVTVVSVTTEPIGNQINGCIKEYGSVADTFNPFFE